MVNKTIGTNKNMFRSKGEQIQWLRPTLLLASSPSILEILLECIAETARAFNKDFLVIIQHLEAMGRKKYVTVVIASANDIDKSKISRLCYIEYNYKLC